MKADNPYTVESMTRDDVDRMTGPAVLDFGTNWCGFCQGARPKIDAALVGHDDVSHIKIEDGKGRALGRSFAVSLWPTLVFLKDGKEVARVVRPVDSDEVTRALAQVASR